MTFANIYRKICNIKQKMISLFVSFWNELHLLWFWFWRNELPWLTIFLKKRITFSLIQIIKKRITMINHNSFLKSSLRRFFTLSPKETFWLHFDFLKQSTWKRKIEKEKAFHYWLKDQKQGVKSKSYQITSWLDSFYNVIW